MTMYVDRSQSPSPTGPQPPAQPGPARPVVPPEPARPTSPPTPLPGLDHPPPIPNDPQAATHNDPRQQPSPGYAPEEPDPHATTPKAPGEGRPDEHQNRPTQKPGRQNG